MDPRRQRAVEKRPVVFVLAVAAGVPVVAMVLLLLSKFVVGTVRTYRHDLTTAQMSGTYVCRGQHGTEGRLVIRPDGTFVQIITVRDRNPMKASGHWYFASWEQRKQRVTFEHILVPDRGSWAEKPRLTVYPEWMFSSFRIGFSDESIDFAKVK